MSNEKVEMQDKQAGEKIKKLIDGYIAYKYDHSDKDKIALQRNLMVSKFVKLFTIGTKKAVKDYFKGIGGGTRLEERDRRSITYGKPGGWQPGDEKKFLFTRRHPSDNTGSSNDNHESAREVVGGSESTAPIPEAQGHSDPQEYINPTLNNKPMHFLKRHLRVITDKMLDLLTREIAELDQPYGKQKMENLFRSTYNKMPEVQKAFIDLAEKNKLVPHSEQIYNSERRQLQNPTLWMVASYIIPGVAPIKDRAFARKYLEKEYFAIKFFAKEDAKFLIEKIERIIPISLRSPESLEHPEQHPATVSPEHPGSSEHLESLKRSESLNSPKRSAPPAPPAPPENPENPEIERIIPVPLRSPESLGHPEQNPATGSPEHPGSSEHLESLEHSESLNSSKRSDPPESPEPALGDARLSRKFSLSTSSLGRDSQV